MSSEHSPNKEKQLIKNEKKTHPFEHTRTELVTIPHQPGQNLQENFNILNFHSLKHKNTDESAPHQTAVPLPQAHRANVNFNRKPPPASC